MIARVWHGATKPEHADAYEAMLKPELLPGIGKVKGFRHSYLLRRNAGQEVEFITVMFFRLDGRHQGGRRPGLRNLDHPRGTAQIPLPPRRQKRRITRWCRCIRRVRSSSRSIRHGRA